MKPVFSPAESGVQAASAELEGLLLDLLSPVRSVAQSQLDGLADAHWERVLHMVRQHRLGPLLHWQLARAHSHLTLPTFVRAQLQKSYQHSTLRNLSLQRELLLVCGLLQRAGIPFVALKGAFLAHYAYPQPALRPLRDLDVLVPAAQVLQAYAVLLEGGLYRADARAGQAESLAASAKHLPPLYSASGAVKVELHARLHDLPEAVTAEVDLSGAEGFWDRTIEKTVAGTRVRYVSPTDLLLHLIVHAVYDHEFNNGPLLLSDLAFLIDTQPIDWPLFWQLAARSDHARGCWLALRLMEHYWGPRTIGWPAEWASNLSDNADTLALAAKLMLRDFDVRAEVGLHATFAQQPGWGAKMRFICRRLFISRQEISEQFPVPPDSWRVFFYYPARWWRHLTQLLPSLLRARARDLHHESTQVQHLRRWLAQ